jgi:hypothetical protein
MLTAAAVIVVALFGLGVFFFLLKRTVRLFIRLALLGIIALLMLAGAFAWWWYGMSETNSPRNQNRAPATTRPARGR